MNLSSEGFKFQGLSFWFLLSCQELLVVCDWTLLKYLRLESPGFVFTRTVR